jgi:eukaryotic-like serine/threonine-protein kinase
MGLTSGSRLGPYEILAPIGAGGMGEVYRARDSRLGRDVAVKVLPETFARDAERLSRFQREAKMLAALNHPNIAAIYGLEDSGPTHALVMELVEGPTLADRITAGPIPVDEAVLIARQIAEGLEYAHERGIVHRDLKPANIKVSRDDSVKILDFGLAKAVEGEAVEANMGTSPTLTHMATQMGFIIGTAAYMSPEQAKAKPVDRRADIWAFGCVLYEMLTAKKAFSGESITETLAAVIRTEPDWSQLPAATPLRARVLLQRCLQKDPKQRLRDIGDARISLDEIISGAPLEAPSPRELAGASGWRAAFGRQAILAWSVAASLAIALAVLAWAYQRGPSTPSSTAGASALRASIIPPEGANFSLGNNLGGIALSPDGKTAAFVTTVNGETALWVRPLDGTDARMLPGTDGAFYPFWSPDSKSIAFFTTAELHSVDLAGGTPFAICEATLGRGGAWTSDGQIIFGAVGTGLFRVSASGGTPSPLTTVDVSRDEQDHRWPQMLPDGRLLFWVRSEKTENTGIDVISLAKPSERVHLLTTDTAAVYAPGSDGKNYLVSQREGTLVAQELDLGTLKLTGEIRTLSNHVATSGLIGQMVATVSGNGLLLYNSADTVYQLSWFDPSGKRLGTLGEPDKYVDFRLSPDGRSVAASLDRLGGADIWLLDADRGVSSRFTSAAGNNFSPIWSPDGQTILFNSRLDLTRKDVAGFGDAEHLTDSRNVQRPTDWSRDGKLILYFESAPTTGFDLWVLPVTPDGKPTAAPSPYLRTQFNEWYGRFSPEPNPRWVAYQSDESGRFEIYIDAFPEPRNKVRISTGGGEFPEWSQDGRELYYMSPDLKTMEVSLKTTGGAVETSPPRELFALPIINNGFAPYDVTPDGKRFLVRAVPAGEVSQPLTLVSNWSALLKQAPPAQ